MRTRKWIAALTCVMMTGGLLWVIVSTCHVAKSKAALLTGNSFANTEAGGQLQGNAENIPDRKRGDAKRMDASVRTCDDGCAVSSASSSNVIKREEAGIPIDPTNPGSGTIPVDPSNPGSGTIPVDPSNPGSGTIPVDPYDPGSSIPISVEYLVLDENWSGGQIKQIRILPNVSSYTLPSASCQGMTCCGWSTEQNGYVEYAIGETVELSGSLKLYAVWQYKSSNPSDFVIEDRVLKEYKGPGGIVIIPEGVTQIGEFVFGGCSSLFKVIIPEGVIIIGKRAFEGCSSLTEITIPEGVIIIGERTFLGCSSLTKIIIPEGATQIGALAFGGCSSLTEITIPEGVIIGERAFEGCTSLTKVIIPEGVTQIGEFAFYGCTGLTKITLPNSVNSIADNAFLNCPLQTIYAPDNSYAQQYAISHGIPVVMPKTVLKGASVDLSDIISLKLYYAIDEELLQNGVYAHIIYADGKDELQEITGAMTDTDGNGDISYVVTCRLSPKAIGDNISIQLCNRDKSETFTDSYTYSVEQYCQSLLAEGACTEEERELVRAMLTYGTCSQMYFDYNASNLVLPEFENGLSSAEEVREELADIPATVIEGILPEGITLYGSSLVLNSAIAYRMYFRVSDDELAETCNLVKSGQDGLYYWENETVNIAQVGDILEYHIGNAVIRSCPLSYVEQIVNGEYSEKLTDLCIAIYDYYNATVKYAKSQQ